MKLLLVVLRAMMVPVASTAASPAATADVGGCGFTGGSSTDTATTRPAEPSSRHCVSTLHRMNLVKVPRLTRPVVSTDTIAAVEPLQYQGAREKA